MIVAIVSDPSTRARLERAAGACTFLNRFEDLSGIVDDPAAIVVDLELPAALDAPPLLRERFPHALLAGIMSMPDKERWERASAAGYDLVANRGSLPAQLGQALQRWTGPAKKRRARLFEHADVIGRLGVVHRDDASPVGPIAVYQLAHQLYAVADECPHAGARLSHGELADGVITCPLHGSQFDVRSGDRVRGPSDTPIAAYPVVVEGGVAYLEYD